MSTSRRTSHALAVATVTLVAGCAHDLDAHQAEDAPPPATAAVATTSPPAASDPVERPSRRIESYEALTAAAWKACEPAEGGLTTSEMKLLHGLGNVCLDRRVVAELDRVLWPLKAARSPRFRPLMKEQALYNRFAPALGELVEQAMWIDLDTAARSYGSCYDCGRLACATSSAKERLYYARALQAGDAAALAERIEAVQTAGGATLAKVSAMSAAAARWARRPAPEPTSDEQYASPEDWRAIERGVRELEGQATDLAASTCEGFPGLSAALGDITACREKTRRYYAAHCSFISG
ncbi:MAG: hypothetical protein QM820_62100 [Minicystis sp.]